ncbi:MAG: PQQ-dependent dehydrogenase, methanol/ethanol family [Acidobacteriota bacterium]
MTITKASVVFFVAASVTLAQEHTATNGTNPIAGSAAAVAAGEKLYRQTCQACHGGQARGDRGPALATNNFAHGSDDGDLFRNISSGIRGTAMPAFSRLTTDQVWQLVSYIRSLSGGGANEVVTGDAAAGEGLFFGKAACSSCHAVNERGGLVGPDLSAAGRTSAATLRAKILNPDTDMNPTDRGRRAPSAVVVKTDDGREIRGVLRIEDTFSLQMTDLSGERHLLDKAHIQEQRYEFKSLMPDDFAKRLSAPEIQNIVAYLKTLNGRDLSKTVRVDVPGGLTFERIRNSASEPQNWLTYWGDYQGRHYSSLKQIDATNVGQMQAKWSAQLPGQSILEATPLVVDGIMYTSGSPGTVVALDARTGLQIWRYQRQQKRVNPYEINPFNRGVAVLGNRVFFGTLDAALVALDARTGLPLWEVQVDDTMKGFSFTSAPLAVKDKIVIGITGGEFGLPGYVDAYDPATGKRIWRFNTVPRPGEYGHDTWSGDSWKRGGAPGWLTGSYDPDLDVLYWPIGNPGPDSDYTIRKGDNLFSCSVVALDPATGQRKWHYQFTPNDSHDWDATEDVVLVDQMYRGQNRKLLLQANRNGMFYALDRTDGKFLSGTAFVRQTWNAGFDENGRPKVIPDTDASLEGTVVYPSGGGGNNWRSPSYDPASHWIYLVYTESGQKYVRQAEEYEIGKQYWGGRGSRIPGEAESSGVMAIDVETGDVKWRFKIAQASLGGGVLATGGGVVFASAADGNLIALDSRTGALLWRFQTGGRIAASPMSYSVDGKQYVAVSAGNVLYSFALPGAAK